MFLHNGRVLTSVYRSVLTGAAALVCVLSGVAAAQTPVPSPAGYTFTTTAGLLILHVEPSKAADFDAVLKRLAEALDRTDNGQIRQQAVGWRMYKSTEPSGDSVPYLLLFDPVIAAATYDPLRVLADALPAETQSLYDRMKAAVLRVERMGLTKIR